MSEQASGGSSRGGRTSAWGGASRGHRWTAKPTPGMPDNVIVLLFDSMNRHLLGAYGSDEFETPNFDRFAERALRFDRHYTGSLPCMPARHDILVGALDFLWRPWGSIEVWEEPVTTGLRDNGVTTMLVTDHPHLFETGGENYHTEFRGWEYFRGGEGDMWKTVADDTAVGTPFLSIDARHRPNLPFELARSWVKTEADMPGPRTMAATCDWLRTNHDKHDRFFVMVDEFDPHEPWDTPEPWANRYYPEWEDDLIIFPVYGENVVGSGRVSEHEARHIRGNYGSKLSMIDHWFGKVLDTLDELDMWDDTAVVVCTDHGHGLGARDFGGKDVWGKASTMEYEAIGHTPLMVAWPGVAAGSVDALTTNIDLHATICDVFDVENDHHTHGRSIVPLVTGEADRIRDWAMGGVWGKWVQVTDGRRKYARAPEGDAYPISMWTNRWSTIPLEPLGWFGNRRARPNERAFLDTMPFSDVPVIRQPYDADHPLPRRFAGGAGIAGQHHCFDLTVDPTEAEERTGTSLEKEMIDLLRSALDEMQAPDDQYQRLGIA